MLLDRGNPPINRNWNRESESVKIDVLVGRERKTEEETLWYSPRKDREFIF